MEPDLANLKFSAADLDLKRLPASPSARVLPVDAKPVVERAWYHYAWYTLRRLYLEMAGEDFVVKAGTPGQDEGALKEMQALGFSKKQIGRMYTVFLLCDRGKWTCIETCMSFLYVAVTDRHIIILLGADNTGIIQLRDFKRFFDLGAHNVYIDRIFQILDR